MIIQYVRNKKNDPVGVVLAEAITNNNYSIGWSKCRKGDKYSKSFGKDVAIGRLGAITHKGKVVPRDVAKVLEVVKERARKYFVNKNYVGVY